MKSILVMGGSDFIGSALAKHLIQNGYTIDILTRGNKPVNYKGFKKHLISSRDSRDMMERTLKGRKYEYIFDMTAQSKDDVKNLIDFVDKDSLKKYIVLSSGAVYKDSSKNAKENHEIGKNENWGEYGLKKKESEDFIINSSIPYVIVRPTYIYGENNNLYREYYFFERISQEKYIPVPHGKNVTTQFIYIGDLVRVLESIMKSSYVREAYNVTNPQVISWSELIQACEEVVGKSSKVKLIDVNNMDYEERTYFPFRNINYSLDIDKLIEHGLYIPNILLSEGLRKSYEWYISKKPKLSDKKMDKVDYIVKIG